MEEQLVSFETAKLAKEKGFDVETYKGYLSETIVEYFDTYPSNSIRLSEKYSNSALKNDWLCTTPTQSLLQKWLREKHNIEIECYRTMKTVEGYNYGCQGENWNDDLTEDMFNFYGKTYEETLEKGLQEALNLIK